MSDAEKAKQREERRKNARRETMGFDTQQSGN
jgi:hypothetical protein